MILKAALIFLFIGLIGQASLQAQGISKTITLTWDDLKNPAGTLYSVYQSNSSCLTPVFNKIKSGVVIKTFDVLGLAPGTYCFGVTATNAISESAYSNSAEATILAPPTNLTTKIITITVSIQ